MAVGLALADKLQGRDRVTACLFGDGAVAEGAFHESLNLAALWKLPVLFLCENNLYAMGTRIERYQSCPEVHVKAAGYGISAEAVDGMNVVAVQQAATSAVEFVRKNSQPYLARSQNLPLPSTLDVRRANFIVPRAKSKSGNARADQSVPRARAARRMGQRRAI